MTTASPDALLVTIGDELLNGQVLDGNARTVGRVLHTLGIPLVERRTVGDDPHRMRLTLEDAAARHALVIVSGGLGPTPDDHTRAVMASLAGVPLLESAVVRARIEALARRRGRPLTAESARQAWLPQGIETLHNPVGLAPGLWLPLGPSIVCALPGVPGELEAMLEQEVVPRLVAWPGRVELESHTLRTMGVPESELARVLAGVDLGGVTIAYLPGAGGVDLRLDARGSGARRRCAAAAAAVRSMLTETLGPVNYATGARRLAAVVLDGLRARGWRLALAESCSGGLIASLLTDEPGSSDVLDASVVTYSNAAKCELLGVPAELVETHGAVSDEVTAAMAVGARRRLGADVGLAVSGIAGPGGGTPEKPVGRVHIAVDGPAGAAGRRLDLGGTRDMVRRRAANLALDLLRRYAEGQVDPGARRG